MKYFKTIIFKSLFLFFSALICYPQKKSFITQIKEWPKSEILMYSVQVGLYSKPKNPILFQPLDVVYEHKTPDGYYRYLYGIYMNYSDAKRKKDELRQNEKFKDCFVRAYYGNSAIPIAKALNLEKGDTTINVGEYIKFHKEEVQKEKAILSKSEPTGIPPPPKAPLDTTTPTKSPILTPSLSGIKMYVGPFKEGVPIRAVTFITSMLKEEQINYSASKDGVTMILTNLTPEQKETIRTRLLGLGISQIKIEEK